METVRGTHPTDYWSPPGSLRLRASRSSLSFSVAPCETYSGVDSCPFGYAQDRLSAGMTSQEKPVAADEDRAWYAPYGRSVGL